MARKRKLSTAEKINIISLVEDNGLTQAQVARMYSVHRSRIHHIINDTYGCRSRLPDPRGEVVDETKA